MAGLNTFYSERFALCFEAIHLPVPMFPSARRFLKMLSSPIFAAVRSLDPNLAIADIHAMGDLVTQSTARRHFQTTLLIVFSGVAMFLAAVGVYGVFLACPIPGYRTPLSIQWPHCATND
jgi:hypothetical protein